LTIHSQPAERDHHNLTVAVLYFQGKARLTKYSVTLHQYPDYDSLDITKYETLFGFYTLGFIQHHRPDFDIIDIRLKVGSWNQIHALDSYDWLEPRIQQSLALGKKVVIIPEDEHVVFSVNTELVEILNRYIDSPVYWITMIDSGSQHIYKIRHGIRIKMLELPWMMMNECLTYYRVANTVGDFNYSHDRYNFFCLIGNTRSAGIFKIDLARQIHQQGLSNLGLITVSDSGSYPEDLLDFCQVNPKFPYTVSDPNYPPYARQTCVNGVWISKNVENFLHIDRLYHDIPLAINPETTPSPFKSTEKSIWPALLGKLFMTVGRPGTMKWIQRFYDIDLSQFVNLDYDSDGDTDSRLYRMISDNQQLIKNSSAVYQQLKSDLESARWTLGANMYKFFISQLENIV